ncbi:hypothetical protein Pen02_80410 [Plantactinospora endophytica]|uniref:Uncharacterized protein n=1 Tax=Plantactinospora endophytica TaxID=673535 RepID=A0ABQ4EEG5_9ACTN|nr:hypothetical protein [Plantactinospora endophytica]GIG93105.1 hypothetical protein Pen02_80410 [Plantactinospora endophytica]
MFTQLFLVTVAIDATDLIFAFDSIPVIFGITGEPYLVFGPTCSRWALRQLYFLFGLLGGGPAGLGREAITAARAATSGKIAAMNSDRR